MSNELTLGNVSVAGVQRLAIVTIYDEDGKEVPVTDVMKSDKAIEAYRSIIQEIVDKHKGCYNLDEYGEIESMTVSGISYSIGCPPEASHTAAKTDALWNKFSFFLMHPQMIGTYRVEVELVDLEKYDKLSNVEKFEILKRVHEKRQREVHHKELVSYTDDERLALRVFQRKHNPGNLISREQEATLLFNYLENELAPLINTST